VTDFAILRGPAWQSFIRLYNSWDTISLRKGGGAGVGGWAGERRGENQEREQGS